MENIYENFMLEAIKEAEIGKSAGNLPFGSVVVFNNEIISRGHAEDSQSGDITRHAELLSIQRAGETLSKDELSKSTLYSTNEPCVMCTGAILNSGILSVVIGVSRGDMPNNFKPKNINFGNLIANSSKEIIVTRGVLKDRIILLFDEVVKNN